MGLFTGYLQLRPEDAANLAKAAKAMDSIDTTLKAFLAKALEDEGPLQAKIDDLVRRINASSDTLEQKTGEAGPPK